MVHLVIIFGAAVKLKIWRDSWFHFKRNWQQYLSYFYRLIDLRKVRSYINIGTSSRCHFHFILATYFIFHSLCPCLKFFTSWYFSKYLYRKCEQKVIGLTKLCIRFSYVLKDRAVMQRTESLLLVARTKIFKLKTFLHPKT